MIAKCMQKHKNLDTIIVALESTSVYSVHIANFLSTCETLMPYKPYVFCVNPKATSNYRKSYIGMEKTDPIDAFLIADFARVGRTKKLEPWRGGQFIALKRLTRHRMHLSECITREKTYMVSNLYLKFSELQLLEGDNKPFSNIYGATSSAILTEFLSPRRSSTSQRKNSFRSSLKKAGTVFLTYPGHPSFCGKPQGTRTVWINACMNH